MTKRTVLLLALFSGACTSRGREGASRAEASTSAPLAVLSNGAPAQTQVVDLGYQVVIDVLGAIGDCVGKRDCSEKSLRALRQTPLGALLLPAQVDDESGDCAASTAEVVQSGVCGLLTEQDATRVREVAALVVECLNQVSHAGAACIAELRMSFAWVGRQRCSREQAGELQDNASDPKPGVFVEGEPWAIQWSGVGVAAWSFCLDGVGSKPLGLSVAGAIAAE